MLAALCTVGLGCAKQEQGPPFDTARPNVVLISIDTLRADHLPGQGYFRDTAPTLTRLAQEGFSFDNAVTVMSHTLPAHLSLFTGVHPLTHRVLSNTWIFKGGIPTLAERLDSIGYRTAGFAGGLPLNADTGIGRGFGTYVDTGADVQPPEGERDPIKIPAEEVNRRAFEWLSEVGADPFFLFLHYFDVHEPYEIAEDEKLYQTTPELEHWMQSVGIAKTALADVSPVELLLNDEPLEHIRDAINAYDDQIRRVDRNIDALLRRLDELGQLDNTFFVVTADHGEGLGQHDYFSHGLLLYEEQARVPLIVRCFGSRWTPRRIGGIVSLLDLFPTLLELVGLRPARHLQGESLLPLMRGDESKARGRSLILRRRTFGAVSMRRRGAEYATNVPLQALRERGFKYLLRGDGVEELYDLRRDPGERTNLVDQERQRADRMKQALVERQNIYVSATAGFVEPSRDEKLMQGLGELGYTDLAPGTELEGPEKE